MFRSLLMPWLVLAGLWLAVPGRCLADDLPVIKAVVQHPVVPELMGGCSMRCAFPWQTFAIPAGKPRMPVYALDDNDAETAYTDPGSGVGTRLLFEFPKKLPKELNDTPFYGFDIADGNISSEAMFKQYSRVKRARLYYNGKAFAEVTFADTRRWQNVTFDDFMARQGDVFGLEILEVYPGSKYPNAAITELILQGAH